MKLPRTATPLSIHEMADLLARSYEVVFPGAEPTGDELAWLLALARHENANGTAIIQHNWGNRAALPGEDYWLPQWADDSVPASQLTDRVAELRRRYEAGEAVPGKFAAYPSHEIGAQKFLNLFKSETNRRIIEAARANDAGEFHRAISLPHPKTGMAYCPDCTSGDVRAQYSRLKEDSVQFFPTYPKAQAEATGPGSSSPSESSRPLPGFGVSLGGSVRRLPTLRLGAMGQAVQLLQLMLGVHVDGAFGSQVQSYVKGLQRRSGIEVDGLVGPETWRVLLVELGDKLGR